MIRLIFKRLLLVQLVVSSISILGNTIDGVIVARLLGAGAIAACGLLNPFAIVAAAISDVITSGTQVVCSRSVGAGDKEGANRQLGVAFALSFTISTGMVALGYIFIHELCLILGANPGTLLFFETEAYARGLLPSLIPATPIALMMFTCVSNGDMMRCRIAGGSIVSLNIVFSIVSILVFDGGLFGVGLSTSLSTYLVFFYLLGHFKNKSASLRPSFAKLDTHDFRQIIFIGSPRATYKLCTFLLILLFNNILLDFCGQDYVVAYSVVRSIFGIVSFATAALYYCTSLISSTFFGEENRRALHDTVREFTRLGLIMGIIGFALMAIFGRLLTLMFLDAGTEAYETAVLGLSVISTSLPFCAVTACFQNYFIGTGHQRWGVVLNIITILVLTPAAGFLLMPFFDYLFVYAAFPAGYILELVLIGIFVACKKRKSPFRAESYLFVPESFGSPREHELSFEVHEASDLASVEARFGQLCCNGGFEAEGKHAFRALSAFASTRMERREGRPGEACFVRAFCKDGMLNLIIWNTFGLMGSNPISKTLSQGRELLRNGRLPKHEGINPEQGRIDPNATGRLKDAGNGNDGASPQTAGRPDGTSDRQDKASPKKDSHLGRNEAQPDAALIGLPEGCDYSLSNPFGLERLCVSLGKAQTQEPGKDPADQDACEERGHRRFDGRPAGQAEGDPEAPKPSESDPCGRRPSR